MSNIIDKVKVSGTIYTLSATSSGGTNAVEITQDDYDALVSGGTVDPTVFYIITDAQGGDLSNYWTSAQTNSAITAAVSGKQDTLSAGTGIDITDNVISATGGGGGGSYSAGNGIDITNDTISVSLPISAGTGSNSIIENSPYNKATSNYAHAEGHSTSATSVYSHAEGYQTLASGQYAHAEGGNTSTSNSYEHASGYYNVSNKASTTLGDNGNTLFSVGNGTSNSARHNAFEIRQNGDIYIADTNDTTYQNFYEKPMMNLQDKFSSIETSLGGMKLVKLTESEYTALVTKDSDTLYVVIPDPSN